MSSSSEPPHWAQVDSLRAAHVSVFVIIYGFYGYQVCPYLETLSLWALLAPPAFCMAVYATTARLVANRAKRRPVDEAVRRLFKADFGAFAAMGVLIAALNYAVFDFPPDSGVKVLFAYLALGLYVSLDLSFAREMRLADNLRQQGKDFPSNALFLPFQTKLVAFSMINIAVVSLVVTMVVLKDLIWAAKTDLDPKQAQLIIMLELCFILLVLSGYLYRVIRQYARKTNRALQDERAALSSVAAGDYSSRVTIASRDELGDIAALTNDMIERLAGTVEELARTRDVTIKSMVTLSAKRDNETGLHLLRTQLYVVELARELAQRPDFSAIIDEAYIARLGGSAPLHDIGKVGVPDAVLTKPGRLSDAEYQIMKTHAAIGAEALADADHALGGSSFLAMARDIAMFHHERWDGLGYPHGLSGTAIPLAARLMAIADVYDALRSKRVYKPARPHEEARTVIVEGRGTQFDPDLVDAFIRIEHRFEAIAARYDDEGETASGKRGREPMAGPAETLGALASPNASARSA